MPAISHLRGGGGTGGSALGVTAGPVAAYHLCSGVGIEPGRQCLGGAFGQDIDRTVGLHVDQDGSVVVPLAECEVIDAEHVYFTGVRVGQGPDESKESVLAQADGLELRQPGRRPAAQRQGDGLADPAQQHRATAVAEGQVRDLFGEGGLGAVGGRAEEPANAQVENGLLVSDRGVGDPALVTTVDPGRRSPAARAGSRWLPPSDLQPHRPAAHPNEVDVKPDEVREQNSDELSNSHPA